MVCYFYHGELTLNTNFLTTKTLSIIFSSLFIFFVDDFYENVGLVVSPDSMYIAQINFALPISRVMPKIQLTKVRQSQFMVVAKQAITSILEVVSIVFYDVIKETG